MNEKLKSILKGAAVAAAGAMLTYAVQAVPSLAISPALLPVVTALLSIAANAIRKTPLFDPKPVEPVVVPVITPPPIVTPNDWKAGLLNILADALRNAVMKGDKPERERVMGLISDVESSE